MKAAPVRATVQILGERYTIRGEADPEYIAEVGRMVDDRMREMQNMAPNLSSRKLAVLAAINMADELLQMRNARSIEDDQEVMLRTRRLINLLDEGLVGDTLAL